MKAELEKTVTNDPYAERKRLTFEQAEGFEALPSQLQLKEISTQLRALLWKIVHESMEEDKKYPPLGGYYYFDERWSTLLYDKYTLRDHRMADEFQNKAEILIGEVKPIFTEGDYATIFGFLQFVLRHQYCPHRFADRVNWALQRGNAAYRVLDKTIIPISSEAEKITLERAFADLAITEFHGARSHLREAGTLLTDGKHADSIRESIHAVESVARLLAPSKSLKDSLAQLDKIWGIHGGLKNGFNNIYGYTSDENGLRHPLLDDPKAKVDEADALFMISACAAFVSYLIHKARLTNILK